MEGNVLVIVKSGPETTEGKRGIITAREMLADLVLIQNGVYFISGWELDAFSGKVYTLDEDLLLRGLGVGDVLKNIIKVDYDTLVDLMAESDNVLAMF
jgi:sulfur relay protein TusB/DsrH